VLAIFQSLNSRNKYQVLGISKKIFTKEMGKIEREREREREREVEKIKIK